MCGIVAYSGKRKEVDELLLNSLKRLEYRGYDSCGIALISPDGKIYLERVKGRVDALHQIVSQKKYKNIISGLAHTRWATHGIPSQENAHPHTDCSGDIVIVHNGIIENYLELKEELSSHNFRSDTDTEVIAHLLETNIKKHFKSEFAGKKEFLHPVFFKAFLDTISRLKGSFAIASIWSKTPGVIMCARRFSPLVVGVGKDEFFVSSDIAGFLEYTKNVYFVDDNEIVFIDGENIAFFDISGKKKSKEIKTISWDIKMAEKGGYKHFMIKEILESDISFENTLLRRVLPIEWDIIEKETGLKKEEIKNFSYIHFVGCGTAYHACLVAKYLFEEFQIPAQADIGSEFSYRAKVLDKNALVCVITQSGETADTLEALRIAKKNGNKVFSIVNVVGSTVSRESDYVLYTHCGPEISVASTKAFIGQLAAIYILVMHFSYIRQTIMITGAKKFANELLSIPNNIREVFKMQQYIQQIVDMLSNKKDFLYIARGINYPIALEGALKLKEISYLHAEGYPAGEMKHGPIAMIEESMPVIAIVGGDKDFELMKSNIEEAKARGGFVIAILPKSYASKIHSQQKIILPDVSFHFTPILSVIPLQMFAYYMALKLGLDIDKPRNLAKSVTVK